MSTTTTTSSTRPNMGVGWLRVLPTLSLIAVVTLTSTSEWHLARTVLDLPPAVAWSVPVAIDAYVIAAFRSGRDIPAAIAVMAGALTAATGSHLAARQYPGDRLPITATAPTAAVIMAVLVVVAWRVHVLIDHPRHRPVPSAEGTTADTPAPVTTVSGTRSATPALATPEPATPPTTPATDTAVVSVDGAWSDAGILADATGATPGVRELMRTYRIGQRRASRLHRILTTTPEHQHLENHNQQPNNPPSRTDPRNPGTQSDHLFTDTAETTPEKAPTKSRGMTSKESDPGITDRVGHLNGRSGGVDSAHHRDTEGSVVV
jgi:hypothetical protein